VETTVLKQEFGKRCPKDAFPPLSTNDASDCRKAVPDAASSVFSEECGDDWLSVLKAAARRPLKAAVFTAERDGIGPAGLKQMLESLRTWRKEGALPRISSAFCAED
jgi:hypothetical protein